MQSRRRRRHRPGFPRKHGLIALPFLIRHLVRPLDVRRQWRDAVRGQVGLHVARETQDAPAKIRFAFDDGAHAIFEPQGCARFRPPPGLHERGPVIAVELLDEQ